MKDGLEIERVWLLRALPPLPAPCEVWTLEQGYMCGSERGDGMASTGRVRKTTMPDGRVEFHFNTKRGGGLVRQEHEEAIDAESFDRLWQTTHGRRVRKSRHRIVDGSLIWEIDAFLDFPLVLAELEIPQANFSIRIPSWLEGWIIREVTDDMRYRNFNLATDGPPPHCATR
ncbi:MAG: adenylate cyclase [Phycisphaerales bacterium]|nr:adenylate cyclase [Phycisphaerales bacterium]